MRPSATYLIHVNGARIAIDFNTDARVGERAPVIPYFVRRWADEPAALYGMVNRLEIDLAASCETSLDEVRDIVRRCKVCSATAACEAWLASGRPSAERYGFCPNAASFELLPNRR
jgi:hypothetical protein